MGKGVWDGVGCSRDNITILYRVVRKGLSEKVTTEHSSEDSCREPHKYLGCEAYLTS